MIVHKPKKGIKTMNTNTVVMFLEFYREDGSWIGAAAPGVVTGEFARAAKIVFEGRIELVTHDENGDIVSS